MEDRAPPLRARHRPPAPRTKAFCCESRESETIQHTLLECSAFTKERDTFLKRFYEMHPIARGLSPEGLCDVLMSDDLPHETENTMYRYLIAISRLRLGILTERGEGS